MHENKKDKELLKKHERELIIFYKCGLPLSAIAKATRLPYKVVVTKAVNYLRDNNLVSESDITRHNRIVHSASHRRGDDNAHCVATMHAKDLFFLHRILAYDLIRIADIFDISVASARNIIDNFGKGIVIPYYYWIIAEALNLYSYEDWIKKFGKVSVPYGMEEWALVFIEGLTGTEKLYVGKTLSRDIYGIFSEVDIETTERSIGKKFAIVLKYESLYVPPEHPKYHTDTERIYTQLDSMLLNRKVSIGQLADAVDCDVQEIMNIRFDMPNLGLMLEICNYLGCTLDELL